MRPGDTYRATFSLSGAATGTPTGKVLHNSVVDTTLGASGVITCTTADSGAGLIWAIAGVIPSSGYSANDTLEFEVTATVSGVTQTSVMARAVIEAPVSVAAAGIASSSFASGATLPAVTTVGTVTNAVPLPGSPPSGYATSANQGTILGAVGAIPVAPAASANASAVVAAMATAPVGSVAGNVVGSVATVVDQQGILTSGTVTASSIVSGQVVSVTFTLVAGTSPLIANAFAGRTCQFGAGSQLAGADPTIVTSTVPNAGVMTVTLNLPTGMTPTAAAAADTLRII